MWTDAINLKDFYKTSLGQIAQQIIGLKLRELWPNVLRHNVLGLGYSMPYLGLFSGEAKLVVGAMPAAQGIVQWPKNELGLTALVDEIELPFPDLSMDRIFIVHAIEYTDYLHPLLREVWRVLSGSGRLIVVAPNRQGLWAQLEKTPFGHGQPFSSSQLSKLLHENLFTPLGTHPILFTPPFQTQIVLSSAHAWEKIGSHTFKKFSGVIMTEATKQMYATGVTPINKRQQRYMPASEQAPKV